MALIPVLGFTGACKDPVVSGYPLGNGYRWYLPALMRFNAPDDFSPFGPAGVNPYIYSADDPINRVDPTGHLDLKTGVVTEIFEDSAAKVEDAQDLSLAARQAVTSGSEPRKKSEVAILHGAPTVHGASTAAPSAPKIEVVKQPIPLFFRIATKEERVVSIEADEIAQRGDAIMTGTRGEKWVIKRQVFRKTYDVDLKTYDPYSHTGYASKRPMPVLAEQKWTAFEVTVAWQAEPLKGKPGDFLVIYGPGDYGVVDRDIFFETYMKPNGAPLEQADGGRLVFSGA